MLLRNVIVIAALVAFGCRSEDKAAPERAAATNSKSKPARKKPSRRHSAAPGPERAGAEAVDPTAGHAPGGAPEVAPHPSPEPREAPAPRSAVKLAEAVFGLIERRALAESRLVEETRKSLDLKLGPVVRWRRLLQDAYAARSGRLWVGTADGLTESGKKAIALIQDVEGHGLEPSPYPLARLEAALARYRAASAVVAQGAPTAGAPGTPLARLLGLAAAFKLAEGEAAAEAKLRLEQKLLAADLTDEAGLEAGLAAVEQAEKGASDARRAALVALQDVDVAVIEGFLQYALDFRYLKVAHPFLALTQEERATVGRRYGKELAADLTNAGDDLAGAMASWWPRHPYYEKARAALAKYRQLDTAGSVPPFTLKGVLKLGAHGPGVSLLKKRLAAEGLYAGDVASEEFGDDLDAAVRRYQATHQLDVDGIVRDNAKMGPAGGTLKSLAIPMSSRVRQLRLSLQRWRESATGKDDFYFRVNIPQFEVEVWEKADLVKKHRVIVGNNNFEVDEEAGRRGHLNRTALLANSIKMVVINPVWHVPDRIRTGELDKEVEKDPEYYDKHNFKVQTLPDGTVQVHQMPGSGNALGRIKLLFPNPYSVYMHDTPKKKLFDKVIRTFSHGCMRLDDPVGMAKFLLERDGTMTAEKVDATLESMHEQGVTLKTPVPIYIEYNTVAFAPDSPDPIFLNDVYQYDAAFWNGEVPSDREARFTPKPKEPDAVVPAPADPNDAPPAPAPFPEPAPAPAP